MELKYFWILDNNINKDTLLRYKKELGEKSSTLASLINFLRFDLPLLPRIYLVKPIPRDTTGKIANEFLEELSFVVSYFENVTSHVLNGEEVPLLLKLHGDFSGEIRNIGVSAKSMPALIKKYGRTEAYSMYIDFLESYSTSVMSCPHIDFNEINDLQVDRSGNVSDNISEMHINEYKNHIFLRTNKKCPDVPEVHLLNSLVSALEKSNKLEDDELYLTIQTHAQAGGAEIQGMVYTRDPFTGKKGVYGHFQKGQDRKKYSLQHAEEQVLEHERDLKTEIPQLFSYLEHCIPQIEAIFLNVMELGFITDEDGVLYFINFEKAPATVKARVVSALDLNKEKLITNAEAVLRIKPTDIDILLHPTLDEESKKTLEDLGSKGITASPGTAVGHVFYNMSDAKNFYLEAKKNNLDRNIILITDELLISDTSNFYILKGLVTKVSGIASHAVVMANANGIPCIVGYKGIKFDHASNLMFVNDKRVEAGTIITIEAVNEGRIYIGAGQLQEFSLKDDLICGIEELVARALHDEKHPLSIKVNINNAKEAELGLGFGADGVGLCRTENMLTQEDSLREIRRIIFANNEENMKESLKSLEDIQYEDFKKIFTVLNGKKISIRLMDMPLHELAPVRESEYDDLARELGIEDRNILKIKAESLKEHNPMLGLRACRFGIIKPEIYEMQLRAIVKAAYVVKLGGIEVDPGIMFPLVSTLEEMAFLRNMVLITEGNVREEMNITDKPVIRFRIGSMIEIPSAALNADNIATFCEFFAFGTNDLTQTTHGISRDDSAHYLPIYVEKNIISKDPFKVLSEAVKELVETAVKRGRRVRKDLEVGICGEQGRDAKTLLFCMEKGLDYISCSPFRVLPTRILLIHEIKNKK